MGHNLSCGHEDMAVVHSPEQKGLLSGQAHPCPDHLYDVHVVFSSAGHSLTVWSCLKYLIFCFGCPRKNKHLSPHSKRDISLLYNAHT